MDEFYPGQVVEVYLIYSVRRLGLDTFSHGRRRWTRATINHLIADEDRLPFWQVTVKMEGIRFFFPTNMRLINPLILLAEQA